MKNIVLIIMISCCWYVCIGQNTLKIEGGHLIVLDTGSIVLNNTQFINNGTFTAGTGTVSMTGDVSSGQSAIDGSTNTVFFNLKIDKSSNGCQLNQNIQVDNKLQMVAGNLELNNNNLALGQSNSIIEGESSSSYITGVAGGDISITLDLNNPSNTNPGNLGAEITATVNLGSTTIIRRHVPQDVDGSNGVERQYNISPTTNTGLDATLRLHYLDHELNGISETDLEPFRNNGSSWEYFEVNTFDQTLNYVEATNINTLDEWTLAEGNIKLMPKIMLQGSFAGGQMSDALRSQSLLPATEPFTGLGYTQVGGGGETVDTLIFDITGNDAITDWVFLELRDKNNPATVLRTRAALLQKDGDIVDLNGMAPASFPVANADDYFVAVRHRNHLGIRSAGVVSLDLLTSSYDYTTALGQVYADPGITSNDAMIDLGSGVWGMIRADVNGNNLINVVDFLQTRSNSVPNQIGVYQGTDVNMDGNINVVDFLIAKAMSIPNKSAHF